MVCGASGAQMVPVGNAQAPAAVNLSGSVYSMAFTSVSGPAFGRGATSRTESSSLSDAPDDAGLDGGTGGVGGNGAVGAGVTRGVVARVHDLPNPGVKEGYRMRPLRAVAFGLTASTLGGGAEIGMPLSRALNIRVGGSYIRYDVPFSSNGVDYDPGVKFTAARSTIDWFPRRGGFHVSAGALYFRNTIAGRASVAGGNTFTLDDTTYTSSVEDPIHGSASLVYHRKVAPMATVGFGNILPRSGRHVSVPVEIGGAYLQQPDIVLNLQGTACTNEGCGDVRSSSELHDSLIAEQNRLQKDMTYFQVYPIVSLGLACRF